MADGSPYRPNTLSRDWLRATAAWGGRLTGTAWGTTTPHAAGIDILTISRRLGHANPSITLGVYGHLYPNTDDRAAQVIEARSARVRAE
jgi:integrase